MKTKITHLTSAHGRYDTRIFLKMCTSLAKNKSYVVSLIVADGKGNEVKSNVSILDVGAISGGRISRMTNTTKKVFEKAKKLDSDIYHLHDPELIPTGLKLKKLGKKIIFDAHEDLPRQILGKPYLNKLTKIILSKGLEIYEKFVCKRFSYIITATPFIKEKFLKINKRSIDINNFPILHELSNTTEWRNRKNEICYIGDISEIRGIKEMVKAMESLSNIRLNLVGFFSEKNLEIEVKSYDGWLKVNEFGFLGRNEVKNIMSYSRAGIVIFHPLPNHIDAQPNKMFEYMAAGLPIITSDFPLWKEIVEGNSCGICVNPLESKKIAIAIEYIISHPKEAESMGLNGKRVVLEKYNWGIEEKKLFKIYEELTE